MDDCKEAFEAIHQELVEIGERVASFAITAFGASALDDHLLRTSVDEVLTGMPTPAAIGEEILRHARKMISERLTSSAN